MTLADLVVSRKGACTGHIVCRLTLADTSTSDSEAEEPYTGEYWRLVRRPLACRALTVTALRVRAGGPASVRCEARRGASRG